MLIQDREHFSPSLVFCNITGFGSLVNQGYGAEAKWTAQGLGLQPGHIYRLVFMVHDGDQNKTGGDVGEACVNMFVP